MSLRYKGGLISPSVNPLAANVTTSPNVAQYNGVFTLQQQGQALTSGQWCTDPYYKNTTLLLHADGVSNGSQNNTFLDSSTNAFTITRNGNTTQGSFTPYGPTWSNYFNGSSDYIFAANNAAFQFGSGDFTIEAWVYLTASSGGDKNIVGMFNSGANYGQLSLVIDSSNRIAYYLSSTGSSWNVASGTAGGTLALNTWTHVALVRSGNTFTPYVNGIAGTTVTSSATLASTNGVTSIGVAIATAYVNYFPGYISNARIVKGAAVYTSNFTPSTVPLTAITNTSLLTCQSNRFIDNSTNAFAITVGGSSSIQRFSPFAPQYQYTPAVIGGSGYFDGTGDYLALTNVTGLQPGTSTTPFTIECWIYETGTPGSNNAIWGNYKVTSYPTNTDGCDLVINSSNQLAFRWGYPNYADSGNSSAIALNSWNHVVVCRNSSGSLSCYLNGTRWFNTSSNTSITTATAASFWIGWAGSLSGATINPFIGNIAGFSFVKGATTYDPTLSTLTVPTAPPTSNANTALLCNFTNAGIYDNAMMNDLETVGNAQVSTSVVKYGSGSLYFDGSGDYLLCNTTASNYVFGTGDFTVEMWVNTSTVSPSYQGLWDCRTADPSVTPHITLVSGAPTWWVSAAARITGATLAVNTWYHLAVVRSSGVTKMYLNGVQTGSSYTDTNTYTSRAVPTIGINFDVVYPFTGYLDDFRITKGVARYTATFIPPKVAFANQ